MAPDDPEQSSDVDVDIDSIFVVAAGPEPEPEPEPDDSIDLREGVVGLDVDLGDDRWSPSSPDADVGVHPEVVTGSGSFSVYRDDRPVAIEVPPGDWGRPRLPPATGRSFERRGGGAVIEPDDFYVPMDWPRLFTKIMVAVALIATIAVAGVAIEDHYGNGDEQDKPVATATESPASEVNVFECAGDAAPVARMPPPGPIFILGRTADSRWLAFRNPSAPPNQLWVLASDIPDFVPSTVGTVSCASGSGALPDPSSTN